MDSPVIEVGIGMVLTFALVAGLTAVVTELVARFLGLRARFLLLGLRELLDGDDVLTVRLDRAETAFTELQTQPPVPTALTTSPTVPAGSATEAVLGAPIMRTQGMSGSVTSRKVTIETSADHGARLPKVRVGGSKWIVGNPLRRLPSYVPARTFSAAVIDLIVPDATGKTDLDEIRERVAAIKGYEALTEPIQSLLKSSGNSIATFRESVEAWYDDHMARVSGWYKRHVAKWSLGIGIVLVLVLNINSIGIARTLFTDDDVRTTVTAVAAGANLCDGQQGQALSECLGSVGKGLQAAHTAGLPIGWAVVAACQPTGTCQSLGERYGLLSPGHGWWDWHPLVVLFGWMLTMVALVPGARFWFDVLGRLGSLRTTGPKPAGSA